MKIISPHGVEPQAQDSKPAFRRASKELREWISRNKEITLKFLVILRTYLKVCDPVYPFNEDYGNITERCCEREGMRGVFYRFLMIVGNSLDLSHTELKKLYVEYLKQNKNFYEEADSWVDSLSEEDKKGVLRTAELFYDEVYDEFFIECGFIDGTLQTLFKNGIANAYKSIRDIIKACKTLNKGGK